MNEHIYLISGLGADERVFQNLDFGRLRPTFIQWIEPKDNESIQEYALRLSLQIKIERIFFNRFIFYGFNPFYKRWFQPSKIQILKHSFICS